MRPARGHGGQSWARAAESGAIWKGGGFAKCESAASRLAICRPLLTNGLTRGLFCGQLEEKLDPEAGTTYAMAP